MEPITVETASTVVKTAVGMLNPLIVNARERAIGDARYYTSYVEIARVAVRGLYDEYAGILRSVALSDLRDATTRDTAIGRIYDYINGEILRPALGAAINHLREGRRALEDHAESVFIFARTAEKRNFAIQKFDELVEKLAAFHRNLGPDQGGSALSLPELRELDRRLKAQPFDPDAVRQFAEELVMGIDKSSLSLRNECDGVIEAIRVAFR